MQIKGLGEVGVGVGVGAGAGAGAGGNILHEMVLACIHQEESAVKNLQEKVLLSSFLTGSELYLQEDQFGCTPIMLAAVHGCANAFNTFKVIDQLEIYKNLRQALG